MTGGRFHRVAFAVCLLALAASPACLTRDDGGSSSDLEPSADLTGASDTPDFGELLPGDNHVLVSIPDPIDFGTVACGTAKDLDVVLSNDGPWPIVVTSLALTVADSTAFTLESILLPEGAGLPGSLPSGARISLSLRFMAASDGAAHTVLTVEGTSEGQAASWSFAMVGNAACPTLVASPGQPDFGSVPLQQKQSLFVEVANTGSADLQIPAGGLALEDGSDVGLAVKDLPAGSIVIAPGTSFGLTVSWTPQVVSVPTGDPIGTLRITSNDPASPTRIPLFGKVDAPCLSAMPNVLDMGFGAQQTPVARTVTLLNQCSATLHVASIEVVDPSPSGTGDAWTVGLEGTPTTAVEPFDIPGAGSPAVRVTYTANPGASHATATLRIVSNDPKAPTLDVPLSASIAEDSFCKPTLVPAGGTITLTTATGTVVEAAVNLVNTGTGACTFQKAEAMDCPIGTDGQPACAAPFEGVASTAFSLTGLPPADLNGLAPGSTTPFTVRFAPAAAQAYSALMALQFSDPALGTTIVLPKGSVGGIYAPNLTGTGTAAP